MVPSPLNPTRLLYVKRVRESIIGLSSIDWNGAIRGCHAGIMVQMFGFRLVCLDEFLFYSITFREAYAHAAIGEFCH